MIKLTILLFLFAALPVLGQSSMRRCTLLPITDSVGGAIGFKVFEEVESKLKRSNWCTYVSNSGLIGVFSKYRENLPQYLKTKEVLSTVAQKLHVGSVIRVGIINEVDSVEIQTDVFGENGEDLFFSEKMSLNSDEIELISTTINNWLNLYAKTIPYDAKVNGILGDQLTLDVGKGYPIHVGQKFVIKRVTGKKTHPLLKKVVDWDTELLAEGSVFNISDNQALGMVKVYKQDKKLQAGDWVRLLEEKQDVIIEKDEDKKADDTPGTLGILSMSFFGTSSSLDTTTSSGSRRMSGNLIGIDFRAEGWITRQWFGAIEVIQSLGTMKKASGVTEKSSIDANYEAYKLTGGFKYLPVGFFFGPQIDIYGGLASITRDSGYSADDGFGKHNFKGLLIGTAANVPLNREYRFFAQAEFMPFPVFEDDDNVYDNNKSVSVMELEMGVKYSYTPRMTLDGSIEAVSHKAKFEGANKEVSYKDNILKIGVSFNF